MRYPLLVDGRNLYDPAEMLSRGFIYQPIGRQTRKRTTQLPPVALRREATLVRN
jgi:UDPglucose 6-dehydrogenase